MYLWYLEALELPIWKTNFKSEDPILISLVMGEVEILEPKSYSLYITKFGPQRHVKNGVCSQKISKSLVKSQPDQ